MFRIGRDGTYLDFRGAEDESYVNPSLFIGNKISDVMPPEMAVASMECIQRAVRNNFVETMEYQLPIRSTLQDYEARITVSDVDEALVISRNITEHKRIEQICRVQEERAQENSWLAIVGWLAVGVAHEINNPLAIIQGFTELALTQDLPEKP